MIKLQCDKCAKEIVWYSTQGLPDDWSYCDRRELCEECSKAYKKFRAQIDKEYEEKKSSWF